MLLNDLRAQAKSAWLEPQPDLKCAAVAALGQAGVKLPGTELDNPAQLPVLDLFAQGAAQLEPGRPDFPKLVHPSQVSRRRLGSKAGRGAMLHAIAHIEFNAINLALDAVWRYPRMPAAFVADWISVAVDEARHFQLLTIELATDQYQYGDFDAHDGLWAMARKTATDCEARMAIVPRVMEARGLDATPVIQKKLSGINDRRGIDVLQIILDEEIRHVRIGDYWFRQICGQRGASAEDAFRELVGRYDAPLPNGWVNHEARLAAGFTESELQWLAVSAADRD